MEKRHSRSLGRRSSILKVDNINRDEDTCTTGILFKGRKSSRRVSFAETYQVKEFPKDSPSVYRRRSDEDEDLPGNSHEGGGDHATVTGLDKLLTGAIQTPVYEHITECPIPEMSSDSLNTSKLFDINRTVLGQVDMDTTDVVETADIDLPFMDTGQDCSREIKFDSASFLRNLKGKPSDCLKTMQIFSPTSQYSNFKENIIPTSSANLLNDRSPLKSIPISQESEDNLVYPEKPHHLFDENDFSFEPKIDAKSFLTNLLGPKQNSKGKNSNEELIICETNNSFEDSMDETTCYGGIVGKDAVKELTNQITAKMKGQDTQTKSLSTERQPFGDINILDGIDKENYTRSITQNIQDSEVTTTQTFVMEETNCLGGLLNKSGSARNNRNFSFHETEKLSPTSQTIKMEETTCVGGLLNKTLTKEPVCKRLSDETTKVFQSLDMDETKCQGGILNKTNFTAEFGQLHLSTAQHGIDMEETKCLTGSINKTVNIEAVSLYESKHDEPFNREKPNHTDETKVYQYGLEMEETKCLTGLINKTITNELTDITKLDTPLKMEEAVCQSVSTEKIIDKESMIHTLPAATINNVGETLKKNDMYSSLQESGIERHVSPTVTSAVERESGKEVPAKVPADKEITLKSLVAMKETKSCDNIANKSASSSIYADQTQSDLKSESHTPNQTLLMEETKCVGGIVNKTITKDLNKTQADMTKVYQNFEMEETKCQGGILNKTNATNEIQMANNTVEMEQTKCLGSIMNKTITKELSIKPHSDVTKVYQNFDMEETNCQGGILNKTNAASELKMANKTVEMEETTYLNNEVQENAMSKAQLNDTDSNKDIDSGEITFNFKSGLSILKDNKENMGDKTIGNQTVLMEETKCVGGLLNKSSAKNHYHERDRVRAVSPLETTVNHTVPMEETKCFGGLKNDETTGSFAKVRIDRTVNLTSAMEITSIDTQNIVDIGTDESNVIENGDSQQTHKNMDIPEAVQDTNKYSERAIEMKAGNVKSERPVCRFNENTVSIGDKSELLKSDFGNMDQDDGDEMRLKRSSGETDSNFPEEITREATQSQARLQKLRDMLILSKKKTPTHFKRPAEPKTDINVNQGLIDGPILCPEEMRSPAHKKKRLFDYPIADISKAGDRTLSASDIGYGIDDEQMPDLMKMDDFMSVSAISLTSVTTHCAADDTLKSNPVSNIAVKSGTCDSRTKDDSVNLDPDAISSNTDTLTLKSSNTSYSFEQTETVEKRRLPSGTSTLSSDTTTSSGNKDMSSYQKSFHSFMSDSVIVPGVPVTLDTFKKAMMIKSSLVKNWGRRSSFMAPRVDTDDMGEVLLAELTLDPEVKATMAAYDDIKERTNSNEETATQLQADLEETQPPIFQDCVELEGAELQSLRNRVNDLHKNCHKLSKLNWVKRTKEATSEALKTVQDKGLPTVRSILDEIRSDKEQTERLIQSIDDDLEDFMKTTQQLGELEQKKNTLESELENILETVEKQEEIKEDLSSQINQQDEEDNILGTLENVKQDIRTHLFCQEWDLASLDESCAVFTFLEKELELRVTFNKQGEKLTIQSVDVQSHLNPGCTKLSKRLSHSMVLAGINTEMLQKKYCSFDSLPQLLYEVSGVMSEISQFCADFQMLYLSHDVRVDHRRILCDFWSLKTLDEITVQLDFSPTCPLSSPANIDVTVIMGKVRRETVIEDLQSVKPGKKYLSRLFSAVRFQ